MRLRLTILSLASLALLTGCAGVDPWGVFERVPPSRSEPFKSDVVSTENEDAPGSSGPDLSGRTLSLPKCVHIALEHNPRTAAAWQAARAAAARAGRTRAEYLPALGFRAGASRGNPVELDGKADTGTRDRYEGIFGARWLLLDGGGRQARVEGAEAELLAANFRHSTVLQDLVLSVEEKYYNLLAARSFKEVAAETVKQREYQLELAAARHRVGVAARSDVLKAETEKADADLALIRAQNAVHVARGQLARAMGLRANAEFEVADIPEESYGRALEDVDVLLAEAARNRPELKSALAEVQAERAAIRVARSRYWPTFGLDTSYGWLGRHLLPDQRQWSLGVVADVPLFTGFDRPYQVQGAEADLARAVAERQDVLQGIELEVWTAYWEVIEASEAVEAARRLVASAEESARVAEGEYKNGTGGIVDLIVAQTASTAARNRLVQARLDWHTATARFKRAVGRSLAEMSPVGLESEAGLSE
ncbi:MAG: TolC family protein [Candidatus Brocadiia bacterium]